MTVVQRAHAEGDDKPWFVNQVASHIAAGEQRMSARIEEPITAVEERMSARIEKTETALLTEFHKWASPVAEMAAWTDRVRSSKAAASFCLQAVPIILRLIDFA